MNEKKSEIRKELERVKKFSNEHKLLLSIILMLILLFIHYDYYKNGAKTINLVGGGPYSFLQSTCGNNEITSKFKIIMCYILGYKYLDTLMKKFYNKNTFIGKGGSVVFISIVWFAKTFIYRYIYGAIMFLVIIFAISGSFVFPFLIFGVLLYYMIKSLFTRYLGKKKKGSSSNNSNNVNTLNNVNNKKNNNNNI